MKTPRPYRQRVLGTGAIIREFREGGSADDLVWHQDKRDRLVTVIEGRGWKLQFDGGLPIPLDEGNTYSIPARTWHRVIKGSGSLKISIKENSMAIKLTESKLRQIIREEAKSLMEMGSRRLPS